VKGNTQGRRAGRGGLMGATPLTWQRNENGKIGSRGKRGKAGEGEGSKRVLKEKNKGCKIKRECGKTHRETKGNDWGTRMDKLEARRT